MEYAAQVSVSAARQEYARRFNARWQEDWLQSPRYTRHKGWAPEAATKSHLRATAAITRREASTLSQMRSGHGPLDVHLHRIGCAPSPVCSACGRTDETRGALPFRAWDDEVAVGEYALARARTTAGGGEWSQGGIGIHAGDGPVEVERAGCAGRESRSTGGATGGGTRGGEGDINGMMEAETWRDFAVGMSRGSLHRSKALNGRERNTPEGRPRSGAHTANSPQA